MLPLDPSQVVEISDFSFEAGYRAIESLMLQAASRPTALFIGAVSGMLAAARLKGAAASPFFAKPKVTPCLPASLTSVSATSSPQPG